jgi:hypothetical protein
LTANVCGPQVLQGNLGLLGLLGCPKSYIVKHKPISFPFQSAPMCL